MENYPKMRRVMRKHNDSVALMIVDYFIVIIKDV